MAGKARDSRVRNLPEEFRDEELRLENVVSLGLQPDAFAFSGPCEELLEDIERVCKETGIPYSSRWDDGEEDEIAGDLVASGFDDGFFVQVAQPIFRKVGSKETLQFSWGLYVTRWFYAADLREALKAAIAWGRDNQHAARNAVSTESTKAGVQR